MRERERERERERGGEERKNLNLHHLLYQELDLSVSVFSVHTGEPVIIVNNVIRAISL